MEPISVVPGQVLTYTCGVVLENSLSVGVYWVVVVGHIDTEGVKVITSLTDHLHIQPSDEVTFTIKILFQNCQTQVVKFDICAPVEWIQPSSKKDLTELAFVKEEFPWATQLTKPCWLTFLPSK